MLIRNARAWPPPAGSGTAGTDRQLADVPVADVRIAADRIAECAPPGLPALPGEEEIDAGGCALLPGLHDHHLHLRALAAAQSSAQVGPDRVRDAAGLASRLREQDAALPAGAWLRCVGYHESVAGPLDRRALDRMLANPARPVRVQHRTGALWMLNSAGLSALGLDGPVSQTGVECGADGRPTGRLWRMDRWLADRVPGRPADLVAGLASVSARAAAFGVTGFTDATPGAGETDVAGLAAAVTEQKITQRLLCMARADVSGPCQTSPREPRFGLGPVKILLDDPDLPPLDHLAGQIRRAHAAGRAVAVHCVTRVQLLLTLAALDTAGRRPGDRIEHGALIPAETLPDLRGLTVVSQPHFVAERGAQYLADVAPEDRPDLWRLRTLIDQGVAVAAGSDAPFGGADPWAVIRAAARRPADLGPGEAVGPVTAIRLFLGEPASPGVPRLVAPGYPADLILLRCPPREAVRSLASDMVAVTVVAGRVVSRRG